MNAHWQKDLHIKNEINLHFWSVWDDVGGSSGDSMGHTSEMLEQNHIYPEVPFNLSFPKNWVLELIPNRSVGLSRESKAFRESCWKCRRVNRHPVFSQLHSLQPKNVSSSEKAGVLIGVLPANKQFYEPKLTATATAFNKEHLCTDTGGFLGAQVLGLYPQRLNSLCLQRLTDLKHTGTALWLLETPLDFSSNPWCAGIYISIWDISIITRFKV